jgi:glutamyl-tRNA synthetase
VTDTKGDATRLRFAPAPTGRLHVGSARTALFNWLYARHTGGSFVLRIDDTDRERSSDAAVDHILDVLTWLGLDWDEGPDVGGPYGPYRQSERASLYRDRAHALLEEGIAYRCFCSPDDLEELRKRALAEGRPVRYDGRCRSIDPDQAESRADKGEPFAIRFAVSEGREIVIDDIVRGESRFDSSALEDFVILRADGTATFIFAGAFDDLEMKISHVVRGEDLFSATPRQVLIIEALGGSVPSYAHLPLIVGEDRAPLSKRHGDVSLGWYRDAGFMPEAMINYLALLGWAPDDGTELLSKDNLIEQFELRRVGKNPAAFDLKKLEWMNNHYLQSVDPQVVAERAIPFLAAEGLVSDPPSADEWRLLEAVVPLVQVRMDRLAEIVDLAGFLFGAPEIRADDWKQIMSQEWAGDVLREMQQALSDLGAWNAETIEETLRSVADRKGVKPRLAFGPLRVAVSGRRIGPPLFESLEILGREKALRRIETAIEIFEAHGSDLGPGRWPLESVGAQSN